MTLSRKLHGKNLDTTTCKGEMRGDLNPHSDLCRSALGPSTTFIYTLLILCGLNMYTLNFVRINSI
jgi:hypothetical protein